MLDARDDITDFFFKKRIFLYKGSAFKTKEQEPEKNNLEKIKDDYKKFVKYIEDKLKGLDCDLSEGYFSFSVPSTFVKKIIWNKR